MKVSKLGCASFALGWWLALGSTAHAQDLRSFECEAQGGTNCSGEIPKARGSLTSQMTIATESCPTVFEVRVGLEIDHPWVGDLEVALSNGEVEGLVLDRPGTETSLYGCAGDNIAADFFNSARVSSEDQCGFLKPALSGRLKPAQSLSFLNGEFPGLATYTLRVTDKGAQTSTFRGLSGDSDTGRMLGWTLKLQCTPVVPAQFRNGVIVLALLMLFAAPVVLVLHRRKASS